MAENKLVIEIAGSAEGLFSVLGQAGKSIEGFSANINGHFNGIADVVSKFQKPLMEIGVLLGGGKLFKGAIEETVDFGKETGRLQGILGGTREEASATALAIKKIHGDTDTYVGGITKLTKAINSNEDKLKHMGIQTRDASGHLLSMNQILQNTNQALLQYKEGADRDAAAQQVLGRSWADWMKYLKLTPDLLNKAREEGAKLGLLLGKDAGEKVSAYRNAMQEVKEVMKAIQVNVGLEVMPTLAALGHWLGDTLPVVIAPLKSLVSNVLELFSHRSVQFGLVLLALNGRVMSIVGSLEQFCVAIGQVFNRLILRMDGPMNALGNSIWRFVNPTTAAIAAAVGLCVWLERMATASDRAREAFVKALPGEVDKLKNTHDLIQKYRELGQSLDKVGNDEKRKAQIQKDLQSIQNQLVAMAPEYAKALEGEAKGYREILAAIEAVQAGKKRDLQAKRDAIAADLEAARAQEATSKQLLQHHQATAKDDFDPDKKYGSNAVTALVGAQNAATNAASKVQALSQALAKVDLEMEKLTAKGDAKGGKHWDTEGGRDSETQFNRLKADLDRTKYLKEASGIYELDQHGKVLALKAEGERQYRQFTKAEEVKWLEENIHRYHLSDKEKLQADKMLFEARRNVMAEAHKGELAILQASLEDHKHDAQKRIQIAEKEYQLEVKAYGETSHQAQAAYAKLLRVKREAAENEKKLAMEVFHIEREHQLALIRLEEERIKNKRQLFEITATQELEALKAFEEKKYQIELAAIERELALANLTPEDREKSRAKKTKLEDDHNAKEEQFQFQEIKIERQTTGEGGLQAYINETNESLNNWGDTAKSTVQGVEGAFQQGVNGILSGNMTMADGVTAIWKGMTNAILGSISKIIAQELVLWGIEKAKTAWKAVSSAATVKATGVEIAASTAKTGVAATETAANTGAAVSGFAAAHAKIPFVGWAIAIGFIAAFLAMMGSIKGRAVGGLVTRPEVTLLGEAGPEVVAPEHDFKHWAKSLTLSGMNLQANLQQHHAKTLDYRQAAQAYAQAAQQQGERNISRGEPFMGGASSQQHIHVHGSVFTRDSRELAEIVNDGLTTYQKMRG